MLKSSERKQPVPILAAAQEPLLASSRLGQGERRGVMPAVTAALTRCKGRVEEPWQQQGNPFTLLPMSWKNTSSTLSPKYFQSKTPSDTGFFPSDTCAGGDSLPPPAASFCRALITEWFGLEGTLNTTSLQPPCHAHGHLPLDQAAQSPIQPGFNILGFVCSKPDNYPRYILHI